MSVLLGSSPGLRRVYSKGMWGQSWAAEAASSSPGDRFECTRSLGFKTKKETEVFP